MKNFMRNLAKSPSSCGSLILMFGLAYGISLMGEGVIYPDRGGSAKNQESISDSNKTGAIPRPDTTNTSLQGVTDRGREKHTDTEADAASPDYE
jgi:hypothetical protein